MKELKSFTNAEILKTAKSLQTEFLNAEKAIIFPSLINFYILQNNRLFLSIAEDIERTRMLIGEKYGTQQDDGTYFVPTKNQSQALKEINDLMSIKQELNIYTISISEIAEIDLTIKQMDALLFMIQDE